MNYLLAFILILIVIILTTNMEMFTETFGPTTCIAHKYSLRGILEGFEDFARSSFLRGTLGVLNLRLIMRSPSVQVSAPTSSKLLQSRVTGRNVMKYTNSCSWL